MDRTKSRPLAFAVGVAVVSAAALAVVEWPRLRAWYWPPKPDLAAPGAVAKMEAAVWASGSRGNLETDVPRFAVPEPLIPRIWKRFDPNTYTPGTPANPDHPLGELLATTADGRVTRLLFYDAGPDDVVFTTDGRHYFRAEPHDDSGHPLGGALLLAGTLRHAAASSEQVEPASDAMAPVGAHYPQAAQHSAPAQQSAPAQHSPAPPRHWQQSQEIAPQ